MGGLALTMPLPVPCNTRVTEVRVLPRPELCCLGGPQYYDPLRLPPHRPGLRCGLIPGHAPLSSTSIAGAGGPPQFADQPLLHADSSTPERFRAAPDSMARTAAFA